LDRDGVIVTRRFDYIKDSRYLLLALRTCCLSLQGCDLSVSSPTPDDIKQIRDVEQGLRDDNPWCHKFCVAMIPDRDYTALEK
jgi:hypothetical protein